MLYVKNLHKSYQIGKKVYPVLKGINMSVAQGEFVAVMGPSGSGKSTLLNCISCYIPFEEGTITLGGTELKGLNEDGLAKIRNEKLGFVFQDFMLLDGLTVRENIEVCRYLSAEPLESGELLEILGLMEHQDKFPSQLSGGQQQRCAIARALVKNPPLLLCDEPTGALDTGTAKEILILLEKINRRYGTTMLIVTHNDAIRDMAHKVIRIRDGQISREYENTTRVPASELEL